MLSFQAEILSRIAFPGLPFDIEIRKAILPAALPYHLKTAGRQLMVLAQPPLDETDQIRERYSRRNSNGSDLERASILHPHRTMATQEKERACLQFFRNDAIGQLSACRALEIGCGYGHNLQQLIRWGFLPENLVGSELLADRTEVAKRVLPADVEILTGDSTKLDLPRHSFDLVLLSTVFSSILDDEFQSRLADVAWDFLRTGGAILWYDFVYNNPKNPDVRGVSRRRLRQLFPEANMKLRSITLAPPIARAVTPLAPWLYSFFNLTPLLRTHLIGWLQKDGPSKSSRSIKRP